MDYRMYETIFYHLVDLEGFLIKFPCDSLTNSHQSADSSQQIGEVMPKCLELVDILDPMDLVHP